MFYNNIIKYFAETKENEFWLTTLRPDAEQYYYKYFRFFGTFEFSCSDTFEEYISALNGYPKESPNNALMYIGDVVLFSTYTNKWVVYGERDADIAICAFQEKELMELFEKIYGSETLGDVREAADYAYNAAFKDGYSDDEKNDLIQVFCHNYRA